MGDNDATMVGRCYDGPERRREFCDQHFGEQLQSKTNCANIEKIQNHCEMQRVKCEELLAKKIPMWVFAPLLAILLSILGVAWATYKGQSDLAASFGNAIASVQEDQTISEERLKVVYKTLGLEYFPIQKKVK